MVILEKTAKNEKNMLILFTIFDKNPNNIIIFVRQM